MKYLPWNRLQLDSQLNNGNRVSKQSVSFSVYRTFKKKMSWTPMIMNNGAVFYGEDETQIDDFLETILSQSKKFEESVTIALYDLREHQNNAFEALESKYRVFEYHPYKSDLKTLIKDFVIFRNEIKEKTQALGLVESPHRKILIPIFLLDNDQVSVLSNDKLSKIFQHFLTESSFERIFPFVIAPFAESFPEDIVKAFQWSAFLGSDNASVCRKKIYPDKEDSFYSIRQIVIGTLYTRLTARLTVIHPYKFTPSEYYFKKEQQLKDEDENYNKFLDMLDDGTVRDRV